MPVTPWSAEAGSAQLCPTFQRPQRAELPLIQGDHFLFHVIHVSHPTVLVVFGPLYAPEKQTDFFSFFSLYLFFLQKRVFF